MTDRERRSANRLTDPKALRAVAHPTRLALLGLLRTEGPLTATRAGELLGESSASCSFHLRQLAKYGLVVEAGGGQGRQRPWKATALFTSVPEIADSPELEAASDLFRSVVAESYFTKTMQWLDARPGESEQWQRAAQFGDTLLYLTAAELAELGEQLHGLIDGYVDRLVSPELRPPGARLVSYIHLAFPLTDRPSDRGGTERGSDAP